jgi:hypothetical protein
MALLLFLNGNIINSEGQQKLKYLNEIKNNSNFGKLKAVLVVGPQEDGTASAIASMDEIAGFFREKGVSVYCFYGEKADWTKIQEAANGANFFIYSGHGTTLGGEGKVGGLCLTSTISATEMTAKLKLHKNAMVLFKSVCYGAGSSASDENEIELNTALTRVTDYARPFFECGAACYYANNLGKGCLSFLKDFFDGKSIKECFTESTNTWCKIEIVKPCAIANNAEIGIASADWGGTTTRTSYINGVKKVETITSFKNYDIAFVGDPDFTIEVLSKP